MPSNYFLEGNESDKGGRINLDNTDKFESSEVTNNSEQFHNRVLDEDPSSILSDLRKRNPNKLIIGSININFLASKFEAIKGLSKSKLDILVLQETKIDSTYPTAQFLIEGLNSHLDSIARNTGWGGGGGGGVDTLH